VSNSEKNIPKFGVMIQASCCVMLAEFGSLLHFGKNGCGAYCCRTVMTLS